jgi:hypothetical protein
MAHFYSEIQGNRGEATRMGTECSGIRGHVRGWSSGIKVLGHIDEGGVDVFDVFLTSGSGGSRMDKFIGRFSEEDLEI